MTPDPLPAALALLHRQSVERMDAHSDLRVSEAPNLESLVDSWIRDRAKSGNTRDAYQMEVIRYLVWARYHQLDPLRVNTLQARSYLWFLEDPQPADHFVNEKRAKRHDPRHRLFARPLKPASIARAHAAVRSFYAFLETSRVITHNPFALKYVSSSEWNDPKRGLQKGLLPSVEGPAGSTQTGRSQQAMKMRGLVDSASTQASEMTRVISRDLLLRLLDVAGLPRLPGAYHAFMAARCRWMVALAYYGALRATELQGGVMGNIVQEKIGEEQFWTIRVLGKGNKYRDVAVDQAFIIEMVGFRRAIKLPDYPVPGEMMPLVPATAPDPRRPVEIPKPLSYGNIWLRITQASKSLAKRLTPDDPDHRDFPKLLRLSPHWLRHTSASHLINGGADLISARDHLGHSNVATTNRYLHSDLMQRHRDARILNPPDRDADCSQKV